MVPSETVLRMAGIGQLILVLASLAIPRTLRWSERTADLSPFFRQLFWIYAGYIWTINLAFGLVSTFAPQWLVDGSPLAAAVTGFIALYWGARFLLQFGLDRRDLPAGLPVRLAETALVVLFFSLTVIYGLASAANWQG